MKHLVSLVCTVAAIVLLIACLILITIGALMQPGQPAVLGAVLAGMLCGVLAATFGAVAMMTFQTKFEREHSRRMNNLNNNALPDANIVARYSPSEGLK